MSRGSHIDIGVARHLVRASFSVNRELQDIMALVKRELPTDEYRDYAGTIARAVDAVNAALLERPLAAHPELRAEIEANIARYDRYL